MSLKEKIEHYLQEEKKKNGYGYTLATYDEVLERLDVYDVACLFQGISYGGDNDVVVTISGILHVVEIVFVDNEMDMYVLEKNKYLSRYGDESYEEKFIEYEELRSKSNVK